MASSNVMKVPPKFNLERPFQRFKEEVNAWSTITSVEKRIQGTLVTLSLPDSGKYGDLRGKVIDSVTHGGEERLVNVLKYLREHLGEDEVTEICDKIRAFMEVKRQSGQTVKEYVSDFEHHYKVAQSKRKLKELPGQYLMYTLLTNARVSENDRKLVLSGIDLDKPETIYKETKAALLKYCGDHKATPCDSGDGVQLAPENTFWTGGRAGPRKTV